MGRTDGRITPVEKISKNTPKQPEIPQSKQQQKHQVLVTLVTVTKREVGRTVGRTDQSRGNVGGKQESRSVALWRFKISVFLGNTWTLFFVMWFGTFNTHEMHVAFISVQEPDESFKNISCRANRRCSVSCIWGQERRRKASRFLLHEAAFVPSRSFDGTC